MCQRIQLSKSSLQHLSEDYILLFQRFTFVGSAWSLCYFIPATTANDLRLRRIF